MRNKSLSEGAELIDHDIPWAMPGWDGRLAITIDPD
jgi:hypothetical protein